MGREPGAWNDGVLRELRSRDEREKGREGQLLVALCIIYVLSYK